MCSRLLTTFQLFHRYKSWVICCGVRWWSVIVWCCRVCLVAARRAIQTDLEPRALICREPARSPFAIWGHNPGEALARGRRKLPRTSSWGSERPKRVCNWGFPWQQAEGSCQGKKGSWRTENAWERQQEELMKAVPRVGAGSWRSTWPWAAGSLSY